MSMPPTARLGAMLDWRLAWVVNLVVAAVVAVVIGLAFRIALDGVVGVVAAVIAFALGAPIALRFALIHRDLPEQPTLGSATERLQNDAIGMLVGVLVIVISNALGFGGTAYLPGDVRGEPWFWPAFSITFTVLGLFVFVVFSIRLLQGLGARRK
jgi:hypothetical protein